MGLDMYLYLEDRNTGELIEYSYYRKFNALQGYFVERFDLDNGRRIELTEETINDLYERLNDIFFNKEKAHLLLPAFPGPFFGSYNYDDIYFHYVEKSALDFYHARFLDYNKYRLYFTSDW